LAEVNDAIVSSESEQLILVDENDLEIGFATKTHCHDGDGVLHRAFSLFVFNADGELLLQRRSAGKRLWPLYWSNSCCSHPRAGESMEFAVQRRLQQELGIDAELEFLFKFQYQAHYQDLGSEHELCSVYVGRSDDRVLANPNEISECRFLDLSELNREMSESPEHFTPWFKMEWQRINQDHGERIAALCK
jgi:isopentenyl-diphosphate delta-isomerase